MNDYWWISVLVMLPIFFALAALHEGSHGVWMRTYGASVTFRLYPHCYRGSFRWAGVYYSYRPPAHLQALLSLSPMIVSWILLMLCGLVGMVARSDTVTFGLLHVFAGSMIDQTIWAIGLWGLDTDGAKFFTLTGFSKASFVVLLLVEWALLFTLVST